MTLGEPCHLSALLVSSSVKYGPLVQLDEARERASFVDTHVQYDYSVFIELRAVRGHDPVLWDVVQVRCSPMTQRQRGSSSPSSSFF